MKILWRTAKCFVFLIIVLGIMCCAGNILNTNESSDDSTANPVAKQASVLFFGTSQGGCGINPLMVWDQAGISSYNFCIRGQYIGTTWYTMQDVFNRCSPQIAVLDFESLERPEDFLTISNRLFSLPLIADQRLRFKMYREIIDDEMIYYFPFFRYHNRWKEITRNDDRKLYTVLGCEARYETQKDQESLPEYMDEPEEPMGEREQGYLEKILALTREKGCKLILLDMPCYSKPEYEAKTAWVRNWASCQNIPVIEANQPTAFLEMGLTCEDFADDMHLNLKGQEKLSGYLGEWLSANCQLPDERETEFGSTFETLIQKDRALHAERRLQLAEDIQSLADCLLQSDTTTAISLTGNYRENEETDWPALKSLGLSREWYERGGGFVRGPDGEWLFVTPETGSFLWTKRLGHDDLVLRGYTSVNEQGEKASQISLIMDRSDQSKVSEGVNFLIYSHTQKDMLRAVGYSAEQSSP